jgi:uncharacterized damage-inducible protein DinB
METRLDLDRSLRDQMVALLNWESAHVGLDRALAHLPRAARGQRASGMAHSVWQILEHVRIAQNDILEFSRNPNYRELKWPDEYWPMSAMPASDGEWQTSLRTFHRDLEAFCALIKDPANDLHEPFPHGTGQTLMRQALLIADHNAYHTGEIVAARRALGVWE